MNHVHACAVNVPVQPLGQGVQPGKVVGMHAAGCPVADGKLGVVSAGKMQVGFLVAAHGKGIGKATQGWDDLVKPRRADAVIPRQQIAIHLMLLRVLQHQLQSGHIAVNIRKNGIFQHDHLPFAPS